MLAEQRYNLTNAVVSRPRKRSRKGLLRMAVSNRIACVLVLATMVCLISSVYVGAYARATEKGFQRAQLTSRLTDLKKDNECLRLKLEQLRKPENIEVFATASGMSQSEDMAYIKPIEQPSVAKNTE